MLLRLESVFHYDHKEYMHHVYGEYLNQISNNLSYVQKQLLKCLCFLSFLLSFLVKTFISFWQVN